MKADLRARLSLLLPASGAAAFLATSVAVGVLVGVAAALLIEGLQLVGDLVGRAGNAIDAPWILVAASPGCSPMHPERLREPMTPSRSELLRLLTSYAPTDADEQRYRMEMLDVAAVAHEPFSRDEYTPGHFTASAFVLHPDGERVLLVHHGKLGIWVQPGGHVEPGDSGILEAAMREAVEETGVTGLIPITEGLFDIDVHVFPEGSGQPRHLHLDLRFAFVAPSGDLAGTDEVRDCRWVGLADLAALGVARSVHRPVSRLLGDRLPG